MSSYIVISSPSYGGAEKRFFDIFTSLRRSGEVVTLIATEHLTEQLKKDHPDRQDVFTSILELPVHRWSRYGFMSALFRLLRTLPRGASYHYPLNCLWPLHLGRGDRVSMSMVDCTRVPALFGGTIASAWSWFSFFFVSKIDVLSPSIFSAMQHYCNAPKMSLTPGGTYLLPSSIKAKHKLSAVVFLSRLIPGKGVEDLLSVLPEIWTKLSERNLGLVIFQIAGYGPLESWVVERVAGLAAMGVPASFIGFMAADDLFSTSAIVLSMQDTTNYPSRVVAEALMSGCGVIVRDTGDSRKFGNDVPGLFYCSAQLDPEEMASQIELLLKRVLCESGFQDLIRSVACNKFNTPDYVDYFRGIVTGYAVSITAENN